MQSSKCRYLIRHFIAGASNGGMGTDQIERTEARLEGERSVASCRIGLDVGQADSVTGRKGKRLIPSRWRACVSHVKSQLRISERNARRVLGQHRSAQRRLPVGVPTKTRWLTT